MRSLTVVGQFDEANLGNGFGRLQSTQNRGRYTAINLNHSQRIVVARAQIASKGEVRYVHFMLTEDGADAADHTRHIQVANKQQGSVQRSFDIDAVAGEQARRTAVQYRGARGGVSRGGM